MWKTITVYALLLAGLTAALKFLEYKYLLRDLSLEFYLGVVAVVFTALGVWAGIRLNRRKTLVVTAPAVFERNENNVRQLGISRRELEVLELMAKGHSNQEIAEKLFVSANTIKTHLSNIFLKLEVNKRTQAVQRAKELGLIP